MYRSGQFECNCITDLSLNIQPTISLQPLTLYRYGVDRPAHMLSMIDGFIVHIHGHVSRRSWSYRAIKLLEKQMKLLERVLEKRIRCQVSIDNIQFGFMPGKGTTDAIFIMRQVQEKHQEKKKLYYAFVDLEKALDRVPIEVVRWALRKLAVDEWLIRTVMALYTEACTVVRTDAGLSEF